MKGRHFALVVLVTLCTCAFVWVRLQIVNISYDIQGLKNQEKELKEDCNKLTLQIDEARSPQRLEKLARDRFDMHAPRADQTIVLN